MVGFFESRGFERTFQYKHSGSNFKQAKIDNVKVFELLDSLKGLDKVQLSYIVTEVLKTTDQLISFLGYKVESITNLSEKKHNGLIQ